MTMDAVADEANPASGEIRGENTIKFCADNMKAADDIFRVIVDVGVDISGEIIHIGVDRDHVHTARVTRRKNGDIQVL